jgi:pantoate--beta-alanine ligase
MRRAALVLSRALAAAAAVVTRGERDVSVLIDLVRGLVSAEQQVELEYVEVRAKPELTPIDVLDGDVLLALAARVGQTRLIDNVTISVRGTDVIIDLGSRLHPAEAVVQRGSETP